MKYLIVLLLLIVTSCTSPTIYEKPDNLISKDSMVLLLQDMYIANAAKVYKNKNEEKNVDYIYLIYDKYKIDSTRFTNSNIYYTSRLSEYEEILKKVQSNLDTLLKKKCKTTGLDLPNKLQRDIHQ